MTPTEFFKEYENLIRGLAYKKCKSPDMYDEVFSEVALSLMNAGTVFNLPKPQQIAYIKKAVETTSYCKSKSLRKLETYRDTQPEYIETSPEEYLMPDDRYSPEAEHQDFIGRDKALELAEQWKDTRKLLTQLKKATGMVNLLHISAVNFSGLIEPLRIDKRRKHLMNWSKDRIGKIKYRKKGDQNVK